MPQSQSLSEKRGADEPSARTIADGRYGRLPKLISRRVQEILLVSSPYDSYILEEDGLLSELIYSEYADLGLTNAPNVTRVSTGAEALEAIRNGSFQLVITMLRVGDMDISRFSVAARALDPELEIVLLVSGEWDLARVQEMRSSLKALSDVYVFNGDSKLFLAIVKSIEDRWNAEHDTRTGDVGVIVLIEDSLRFRSSLLPIMYTELVSQTRAVMRDGINRMQRLMRMRARNKILVAETFEQGEALLAKYRPWLVGVVCDVEFPRQGKLDPHAGIELIRRVKAENPDTPTLLQSSDAENRRLAEAIGANFLHKRSSTLLNDVRTFMLENFGFGDFVFRSPDRREVARASDLRSMSKALAEVPADILEYHATRNHFSNWLRARTEFALARRLRPRRVSEFRSLESLRKYLVRVFDEALQQHRRGVVEEFSRERFDSGSRFARIGGGSLGGKARGLAFFDAQLAQLRLDDEFENVHIFVPRSVVIGTAVFDQFLEENHLRLSALRTDDDDWIRWAFLTAKLPEKVRDDLRTYLDIVKTPIAVRSSSLLEDSQHHPFAGVYSTHMIANNEPDIERRLRSLTDAIKAVYASTFFHAARQVLARTPHRIEEEKMAVVLQPIVGQTRESYYYPDCAGVALSYNFYPFGHMKPEDGVAFVALGLGAEVVEGGKALRFCPAYPQILPEMAEPQAFLSQSQREFFAVDLRHDDDGRARNGELARLGLDAAERHGTLAAVGSTWSPEEQSLHDGIYRPGVRAVTFAHMLKSDLFPLAGVLQRLLEIGRTGMNAPVEIEFAVDLSTRPRSFAVLQVRPCVSDQADEVVELGGVPRGAMLLESPRALGNGVIRDIREIVYVKPETFDPAQTGRIAIEIGQINDVLLRENRPCLLIGPGRWGSSNKWLGIPVKWNQISAARAIVETTLERFQPELSQGSHFFHNLTSSGIAYLTVPNADADGIIDWAWLSAQVAELETDHVRLVRCSGPLEVRVDGRVSRAIVMKPRSTPTSAGEKTKGQR